MLALNLPVFCADSSILVFSVYKRVHWYQKDRDIEELES